MLSASKILLILCSLTISIYSQTIDEKIKTAYASIDASEVYSYNKKIASDEFEGRLTGSEGYRKAAEWAASKFNEWGLKPIYEKTGFLQPYNAPFSQVNSASMNIIFPDGVQTELKPAEDFLPLGYCANGTKEAQLVFAGWGISAPDLGYDDYAGLDVKDKFVLCFRGTPDRKDTSFTYYDEHRTRMQTASEKGALGLIYIYPEVLANPNGDHIDNFMPAIISEKIADKILIEQNYSSASLKAKISAGKTPVSFVLKSKINFSVDALFYPDAVGYNIAGYIEGSDPNLKNECIVVGGHFDHCGKICDIIFPGANDNGSGSAVVIEIAEAYSKLSAHPKRSVIFVLFGGEEKGLRGSHFFADNFPKQFSNVDAMFNFDMVGEGEGTNYGYSLNTPGFKEILLNADLSVHTFRNSFEIKNVGVRSSDFAPFFLKGAPVAAFFSNGPHVFYHQGGDTIYRINPDILADIARVGFLSSYYWANR